MIGWFIALLVLLVGAFIMTQSKGSRLGFALVIIGAVFLLKPAFGHDHSRPELAPWFNNLKSKAGALCCSNNDGTAISDADWRSRNGSYEVYLEGAWRWVPDGAVVTEPNMAGRTMVWPRKTWAGISIVCFMPGPGA